MMRKLFLGLVAVAALPACTDQIEHSAPLRSGQLDAIAEDAVAHGFPGVVIAMSEEGGPILAGAAGVADREEGFPMSPGARIHAASTTKAVTAAAALMLIDRGALSLDATLPQLLPGDIAQLVPHNERITVRDLLLHTSGIYSPNNDPEYLTRYIGPERLEKPFWTSEEIVAFAAKPENGPLFEPGEGKAYGDINYVLLSIIVEGVSGTPFKTFVRDNIFDPLGMTDTYYLSDRPDAVRAKAYTLDSEILRQIGLDPTLEADEDNLVDTTGAQEQSDGAAGIITTAPDLVRFADAFLRGNLLSDKSRALVLSVADEAGGEEEALGVLRSYRKPYGLIVTAEGDGPGVNVLWAMDISSKKIVAIGVNLFGRWDESDYMLDDILPRALALEAKD